MFAGALPPYEPLKPAVDFREFSKASYIHTHTQGKIVPGALVYLPSDCE